MLDTYTGQVFWKKPTTSELYQALKTPRKDGLTAEFYLVLWPFLEGLNGVNC